MSSTLPIAVVLVALVVLVSGCTGAAPNDANTGPAAPYTPADYQGPELAVTLEASGLHLSVEVKSGGHKLELAETGREQNHTFVKIKLTTPGADELVTQVLETKSLRVPLVPEAGPVHVHLQQTQRGAHYFTEPAFELAKIVPR